MFTKYFCSPLMLFNPQASLEVWACGPMKKLLLCSWKKLMHHTGRFCFSSYLKQHQSSPHRITLNQHRVLVLSEFIHLEMVLSWLEKQNKTSGFFSITTYVIPCNSIGYYTLNEHITGSFLWKTLLGLHSLTLLAWVKGQSRCCKPQKFSNSGLWMRSFWPLEF